MDRKDPYSSKPSYLALWGFHECVHSTERMACMGGVEDRSPSVIMEPPITRFNHTNPFLDSAATHRA